MVTILIILAICFLFVTVYFHYSANKLEEKFNNRPSIITCPSKDLFTNQKYAIIHILLFAQGVDSIGVYSYEANDIIEQWLSELGLSKAEVEKSALCLMRHSPERTIQIIINSMVEIRDKSFIKLVYLDAERIARISGDKETIDLLEELFNEILNH